MLTQTPGPGESAKPGATITVTVGRYTAPPPPTTTEQVTTEPRHHVDRADGHRRDRDDAD